MVDVSPISAARAAAEATNAAINAEVEADIRDFLQRQEKLGGTELLSLSSVSDWARQSDWSIDTGGERDARGAPVRATGGVWAEMFFQAQAQLVAEASEREQWREYFGQRRELRVHSRVAAESDGRLRHSGLKRVAQMMGFNQDDVLHAIVSQFDDAGGVDFDAFEAWWGARGLYNPHTVSMQAEKELLEAWEKTVSFKIGRRSIPTAWRREFFDALKVRKLSRSDLQTPTHLSKPPSGSPLEGARAKPTRRKQPRVTKSNSDEANEFASPTGRPSTHSTQMDAIVNVASPRTPMQQVTSGVAGKRASGTPARTPGSVGKSLDIALRRNSALGCAANALHLPSPAQAAATSVQTPNASPLLVEQRQQIGNLRAESDLLRRTLLEERGSDGLNGQASCRIFEHFAVFGAASDARFQVQTAAGQVSSWRRPAARKRFEEYASLWVGPPQALCVYPKGTDSARLKQICSLCFPDAEGQGGFTLREHIGLTPVSQDRDDDAGLELDYSTFIMSDPDATSVAVGEAPPRLFGACIRTVDLVYACRRANRCWTLPRVYCLVSRLSCLPALFSLLLAVVHHERASHATTERACVLLGSPRSSSAYLSQQPIASPFTPKPTEEKACASDDDEQLHPSRTEGDIHVTALSTPDVATSGIVYAYIEHRSMAFSVEIPPRASLDVNDVNDAACLRGRNLHVSVPSSWHCRESETEVVPSATVVSIGEAHGITIDLPSRINPRPPLRIKYGGDMCYDGVLRGNAHELADWSLGDALEATGPKAMAQLVAALLTEQRVIIVAEAPSVRSAVALASMSLVGHCWPHLCLPLLCTTRQADMTEMVLAPVPYVIGLPTLEVLEEETLGELFHSSGQQANLPPCVLMVTTDPETSKSVASWHRHGSMAPTYSLSCPDAAGQQGCVEDDLGRVLEAASADLLLARDLCDLDRASKATEALLVAVKKCHGRLHAHCLAQQQSALSDHRHAQLRNGSGFDHNDDFVSEYMRSVMWQELACSASSASAGVGHK